MVALFGGTFDPVHEGHLLLAHQVVRHFPFRRLYFVPAKQNPHKRRGPIAAPSDRLEMLRRAIAESPDPRFDLLDWELEARTPSYTILTVRRLLEKEREPVALIMGNEVFKGLPRWHNAADLVRLVDFVIVIRAGVEGFEPESTLKGTGITDAARDGNRVVYAGGGRWVDRLDMVPLPFSATELRRSIRSWWQSDETAVAPQGIQRSVWQYIKEKRLYTVTNLED